MLTCQEYSKLLRGWWFRTNDYIQSVRHQNYTATFHFIHTHGKSSTPGPQILIGYSSLQHRLASRSDPLAYWAASASISALVLRVRRFRGAAPSSLPPSSGIWPPVVGSGTAATISRKKSNVSIVSIACLLEKWTITEQVSMWGMDSMSVIAEEEEARL